MTEKQLDALSIILKRVAQGHVSTDEAKVVIESIVDNTQTKIEYVPWQAPIQTEPYNPLGPIVTYGTGTPPPGMFNTTCNTKPENKV